MSLPVAPAWFSSMRVAPGIVMIREPFVDPLLQANIFLIEGSDFDLLIDSGMGIASLSEFLPSVRRSSDKPLVHLMTHSHVDHIGSSHEFADRWIHPLEARDLENPAPWTLFSADRSEESKQLFEAFGYPPLPEVMINALPHAGYNPRDYRLVDTQPTRLLDEGETVDLGNRSFRVLVMAGHSPAGILLFDEADGTLFSGDAIYDGPLIYSGTESDRLDYLACLKRLKDIPASVIHGGHDPSFGRERMLQICEDYLERWS